MNDIQDYLVHEFLDEYRARRMDRRAMLKRITLVLGGAVTASAWLQSQGEPVSAAEAANSVHYRIPSGQASSAVTISPDDPSIAQAGMIELPARDGASLYGYIAKPASLATAPGVLLIHENRALQEHNKDVTRRFAREGFVTLAVDLVSREGGAASFADQAAISGALSAAGSQRHVADLMAGIDYLLAQPEVIQSGVGVIGYCFGGSMAWRMAVEDERVAAAVPYYGSAPPLDSIVYMRAAAFGVYAENDARINASAIPLEEAMRAKGKTVVMKQYPGTGHGFFNDTGRNHVPEAAAEAWADTLAWFRQHLPTE